MPHFSTSLASFYEMWNKLLHEPNNFDFEGRKKKICTVMSFLLENELIMLFRMLHETAHEAHWLE